MMTDIAKRGAARVLTLCFPFLAFLLLTAAEVPQGQTIEEAWAQLETAEAHFAHGMKAFKEGRNGDASAAFEKCVQKMPRHAYAHYYLANLAYVRADYRQALVHMEQALGQFDLMQELSAHAAKLKRNKIDSYQQMLDTEWESTTSCRTSRQLESLSGQLFDERSGLDLLAQKERDVRAKQKAHYLYFLGNIFFQLKQFPESLKKYEEAIGLNPRHADAYNNAAAIVYMAGEYGPAQALLERAEKQGLEDNINLKLKYLVLEALGQPTSGILQEDLSGPDGEDLGVMRFALAFKGKNSLVPPLYENAYVVFSRGTKQAVVIDPGVEDPRIGELVKERGLAVRAILTTHGHEDHAGANAFYAGLFGAPVFASKKDSSEFAIRTDRALEDGGKVEFDGLTVQVIRTPGHTPGSLSFSVGDYLFSGDTLFKNDIGKVGEGDPAKAVKVRDLLVRTVKKRLLALPGRTRVCPGHGKTSTIADEIANNPFLK